MKHLSTPRVALSKTHLHTVLHMIHSMSVCCTLDPSHKVKSNQNVLTCIYSTTFHLTENQLQKKIFIWLFTVTQKKICSDNPCSS